MKKSFYPNTRCVNTTFVRQCHMFHHSITCSHYHMPRKIPGKFQETSFSQLLFPTFMGRYACHIEEQFPAGDSSYHTTLCSLEDFRALARPSAKQQLRHPSGAREARNTRACYAMHTRTCAQRPAGRIFLFQPSAKTKENQWEITTNFVICHIVIILKS